MQVWLYGPDINQMRHILTTPSPTPILFLPEDRRVSLGTKASYRKWRLTISHWYRLFCVVGSGPVRWKFVHGLFANAIYGGRVDNTFDLKVLESYLLQYFDQTALPGQVSLS